MQSDTYRTTQNAFRYMAAKKIKQIRVQQT